MNETYNLYPLYVFRVVVRLGSVTRAAEELFVTQPAVSAHLKMLEERFGLPLLERTPRGVVLTAAGEVVLHHASRVFGELDDLAAAAENLRGGEVRGQVLLAASSTPAAYFLPDVLGRFKALYPAADVSLMVGDSQQVVSWLLDYESPMGVMGQLPRNGGDLMRRERIAYDELRLVAPTGDPLLSVEKVEERHLREHTLFLRERGSSTRSGAEKVLGDLIGAFERATEVGSTDAIKQLVAAGLGVAVLSSWATRLEEAAGLLAPVPDLALRQTRPFCLVARTDRPLLGVAAALWDFLEAERQPLPDTATAALPLCPP